MSDTPASTWSLRKFLIRAIPWTVAAAVLWKYTAQPNAAFTVVVTKFLHRLTGFPAPYMFCDVKMLFWHATMFPPVLGLGLASYWLGWPQRVLRVVGGYVVYACLTALAIAINESPYLQQTGQTHVVTSTLVNANYLMFGVVIWLLSCGPWYQKRSAAGGAISTESVSERRHRVGATTALRGRFLAVAVHTWSTVRHGWGTRLVLLLVGVSLTIPLFALTGTKEGVAARMRFASAMRKVPFFPHPSTADVNVDGAVQRDRDLLTLTALDKARVALEADEAAGLPSASLYYLTGHLFLSLRPPGQAAEEDYLKRGSRALIFARETRGR